MMPRVSVDHSTMREMNTALILKTIRQHEPVSRAGLAQITGLNKATVSSMVRDLLAQQLVREITGEIPPVNVEVGRPAISLELNPNAGYLIGVELGVNFILVIVTNFAQQVVLRRYKSTADDRSPEKVLRQLTALLHDIHREIESHGRKVFGIAVGVAGLVDMANGIVLFAPNMGWENVPLQDFLQAEFNIPLYIANEANMAALGESYHKSNQASEFLLYVSSGIGVGGGIVINGELLTGISGFAGEIGHMTVQPDGLACRCGNYGCWETVASQQALFRYVREEVNAGHNTLLLAAAGGDLHSLTVPMLVTAADNGDGVARTALTRVGEWLGIGTANLINIVSPQQVVLGGPLAHAHRYVLPVIRDVVNRRAFPHIRTTVDISIAAYLSDATAMGGVAMIHKDVLTHPMRWMPS